MTKRTPATDVTLSPSLAEILLELENSYIILLLQAKHREILSPPCLLVNRLILTSAQRTGNPVGENLRRSLFIPGLPPSYMTIHLWSSAISHPPRSLIPPRFPGPPCQHVPPRPSALTDSRESRRCDTLRSLNVDRSVIDRDCV